MTFDQATIAGIAAFVTAAVLLLIRWSRVKAQRAGERRRVIAAVRSGHLPTVPAPAILNASTTERVHVCATATGTQSDLMRELGDGLLVISNRRICFLGARKIRLLWKKIESVGTDPTKGVLVTATDARSFAFVLGKGEDAEMIGEVLRAVERAQPPPAPPRVAAPDPTPAPTPTAVP